MSEMLGNQYFLARRYLDACSELEAELTNKTANIKAIQKKLVICYLQTNQFEKAFNTFYSIVIKDVSIITNTNLEKDGCPCPEIIEQNLPILKTSSNNVEQKIKMAILWLYCDVEKSLRFFEGIETPTKYSKKINKIIIVLKNLTVKIN